MKTKNFFIIHHLMFIACVLAFISCEDEIVNRTITNEIPVDVPVDVPIDLTVGKTPISSAEELVKIGSDPDYPLSGAYYLTNDIDLSELQNYTDGIMIGSDTNSFTGTFYGNDKTIKNFKVKNVSPNSGLFGFLSGAYISNLTIEVINRLDTSLGGTTAIQKIGVLTANASYSKIESVTVKSAPNVENPGIYLLRSNNSNVIYLAGIVGTLANSQITKSESEVALKLDNASTTQSHVGGIAGTISGSTRVSSCVAVVNIEANNTSTGRINAGGITGMQPVTISTSKIEDCKAFINTVSATSSGYVIYAGGIVGYGDVINNCEVELQGESPVIKAKSSAASGSSDFICAGGITAFNQSSIKNCHVSGSGTITAETQSLVVAAGGILAYGDTLNTSTESGIISNCWTGPNINIEATDTGTTSTKFTGAGGIIGCAYAAAEWLIENCYSLSSISVTNAAANTSSSNSTLPSAGGLLGSGETTQIKHSYFGGTVTVNNTNASTLVFAGGLAGYSDGEIDASFAYNPETGKPAVTVVTPIDGPTTFIGTDGNTYSSVHRINGDGEVTGFANWAKGGSPCFVTINGDSINPANNSSGADGDNIADISGGLTEDFLTNEIGSGGEDYVWDFTNVWQWDNSLGLPTLR